MKLNHRGFALVETLIVSVFVVGIFTMLYTNYFPIMGEYEKRENYDPIEAVYRTDSIRNNIENIAYSVETNILYNPSEIVKVYSYSNRKNLCEINDEKDENCYTMWDALKINTIIITTYKINDTVKDKINSNNNLTNSLKEYVNSLPNFNTNKYGYDNRIIVEYKENIDIESSKTRTTVYKYSTLGVDL